MSYVNEIEENLVFWKKILGEKVCIDLLENKKSNYVTDTEFDFLAQIDFFYRKALVERIEEQRKLQREMPFSEFYCVFIKAAYFYWKTQSPFPLENPWQDILENLYKRIEKIPLRILIEDIHECKKKGHLIGKNGEEEYMDYQERFLSAPIYIENLCKSYPEMKRLLFLQIYQTVNYMWEIATNLKNDKGLIIGQLCGGQDFKSICCINTGLSDSHKRGKTVTKVLLDNGFVLIYKPHGLQKEILFEEVYASFLIKLGLQEKKLKILNCGTHGWEEYVERKACGSKEEIERYFERTGILLFLCYLMGATDIHGENLLAVGEFPMLLDLETFPGCTQSKEVYNAEQKVKELIGNSVLRTGLLPVVVWGNHETGVIVNALHKNSREVTPFRMPMLCQPQSSEIHMEYQPVEIPVSGSLPIFQNSEINPVKFRQWLCKGFTEAYRLMLKQKEDFKEILKGFFVYKSRYLLRHTQQYGMFLNMSFFPEFLKSKQKRELFLHIVDKQNMMASVHGYERSALDRMDIPIFYADGKSKTLVDGDGGKTLGFFIKSPYELWTEKISILSLKDMKEQLCFIKLSLALLSDKGRQQRKEITKSRNISNTQAQRLIRQIADRVCCTAVIYGEDKDINWSGLRFYDEKSWSFVPLGMYLYDGIGGIAVFLARTLTIYQEKRVERVYGMVTKKLFAYTERLLKNEKESESAHTGAFVGEGSVVYTYLLLYQITQEGIYLDYAKAHSEVLFKKLEKEEIYDFLSGMAGAIVVLLKLYGVTREQRYLQVSIQLGEHLWKQVKQQEIGYGFPDAIQGKALGGMAHGNSGYILAYYYLLEMTRDRLYYERICGLLAYEDSLYCEEAGNWMDLRKEASQKRDLNAWCHGAAGILLTRMQLKHLEEFRDDTMVETDIKRCLKALELYKGMESICLCHGFAGIYWILGHYLKEYSCERVQEKREELLEKILECFEDEEKMLPQECLQVSLMTGVTGVGLALCKGEDYDFLC